MDDVVAAVERQEAGRQVAVEVLRDGSRSITVTGAAATARRRRGRRRRRHGLPPGCRRQRRRAVAVCRPALRCRWPMRPASRSAAPPLPRTPLLAVELGAWAIGLIFHAPSPRCVELERRGGDRRRAAPARRVAGVFVNPPLDEVDARGRPLGLTLLQLHGDEGPAYCAEAARRTGCRVIKAARVRTRGRRARRCRPSTPTSTCSTARPAWRRHGQTFDWRLAAARRSGVPLILSGGLTPRTSPRRSRASGPSRSTSPAASRPSPGRKDPARLEAFFAAARSAAPPASRRRERRRRAPLRPLRRPVRARDADARARRAGGGLARGARRPGFGAELRRAAARLRRAPDAALPRAAA